MGRCQCRNSYNGRNEKKMCVRTRVASTRMVKMRINVSPPGKEGMTSTDTVELKFTEFSNQWISWRNKREERCPQSYNPKCQGEK